MGRIATLVAGLCLALVPVSAAPAGDDAVRAFEAASTRDAIADAAARLPAERLDEAAKDVVDLYRLGTYGEALHKARALAYRGADRAQLALGLMLLNAYGAEQDLPRALLWLELAARNGNRDAPSVVKRLERALDDETVARVASVAATWSPEVWRPPPPAPGDTPPMAGFDGISNPVLIQRSKVVPRYPREAREVKAEGRVLLQVVVTEDGRVVDPYVLSASPTGVGFQQAALEAVSQWRYEPAMRDGTPVEVLFTVYVEFSIASVP